MDKSDIIVGVYHGEIWIKFISILSFGMMPLSTETSEEHLVNYKSHFGY